MTRRPAARSARPVSVMSTMQSAMSGTLASLAPYDSRTSASMPRSAKKRRVSSGYSDETRTPCGRSPTVCAGESAATATTTRTGSDVALRVAQLAEADDVAGRLLHPVAAGDADVEQPLGDVDRDLLRAQDAHLRRRGGRRSSPGTRRPTTARPAGRRPRTARAWRAPANPWAARSRSTAGEASAATAARTVARRSGCGARRRDAGGRMTPSDRYVAVTSPTPS